MTCEVGGFAPESPLPTLSRQEILRLFNTLKLQFNWFSGLKGTFI